MQKLGHADALLQALGGEGIDAAIFADVVEDPTDISIATLVKRVSGEAMMVSSHSAAVAPWIRRKQVPSLQPVAKSCGR